ARSTGPTGPSPTVGSTPPHPPPTSAAGAWWFGAGCMPAGSAGGGLAGPPKPLHDRAGHDLIGVDRAGAVVVTGRLPIRREAAADWRGALRAAEDAGGGRDRIGRVIDVPASVVVAVDAEELPQRGAAAGAARAPPAHRDLHRARASRSVVARTGVGSVAALLPRDRSQE